MISIFSLTVCYYITKSSIHLLQLGVKLGVELYFILVQLVGIVIFIFLVFVFIAGWLLKLEMGVLILLVI